MVEVGIGSVWGKWCFVFDCADLVDAVDAVDVMGGLFFVFGVGLGGGVLEFFPGRLQFGAVDEHFGEAVDGEDGVANEFQFLIRLVVDGTHEEFGELLLDFECHTIDPV